MAAMIKFPDLSRHPATNTYLPNQIRAYLPSVQVFCTVLLGHCHRVDSLYCLQ
jgi:hypothetical protein